MCLEADVCLTTFFPGFALQMVWQILACFHIWLGLEANFSPFWFWLIRFLILGTSIILAIILGPFSLDLALAFSINVLGGTPQAKFRVLARPFKIAKTWPLQVVWG